MQVKFTFRNIILIFTGLIGILMISFAFLGYRQVQSLPNPDNIYRTWKLEKLYQNGKPIKDSVKFADLKLKVNRDGTAEWIRPDNHLKLKFKLSDDGSQITLDDGYTIENIETVFELTKDKFRFGKRNIATQYEYVMVAADE